MIVIIAAVSSLTLLAYVNSVADVIVAQSSTSTVHTLPLPSAHPTLAHPSPILLLSSSVSSVRDRLLDSPATRRIGASDAVRTR